MPPVVGMRFGRYELLDKLGAGGMGEVYRARDLDLGRDVAVKFLPEPFAAIPDRLGRFAQEARAASSLNHPNIVTIHEIGETAGLPFTVMELVDGATLRHLIRTEHPLPARKVLDVGCQLAEGLARAHAAGIVHRDLKPENVMLTRDGFVKILDFGLAKLRGDGGADRPAGEHISEMPTWPDALASPHTVAGAVLGTVGYMSPEQARGRPVDHRSDQFALGAILYEMVSGHRPFQRETPVQTLAAIIEDEPEPLGAPKRRLPGAGAVDRRAVPGQGPGRALRVHARPRPRAAQRAPAPLGGGQLGRRGGRDRPDVHARATARAVPAPPRGGGSGGRRPDRPRPGARPARAAGWRGGPRSRPRSAWPSCPSTSRAPTPRTASAPTASPRP